MSFERPPVSKFALQAQLLNRLVRASFDNVRGAREIAETSGQLERHSYNVSLVARRHRATALAFVPISKSTLWRRVQARTFPEPVKLSVRVTVWRAEDIRRWIDSHGREA